MNRFAFAAAGTGGHVYPALAVAEELAERGVARADMVFFGGGRMEKRLVPEAGYPFVEVPLQGLQRSLTVRNLQIPFKVVAAARRIRSELRRRNTGAMLATGGYVTIPAGWAAHRAGVALFLQEQNAAPGLGNRVAARWARKAFLTLPAAGLDGEVVGNPLRRVFSTFDRGALRRGALERYGLPAGKLVLGAVGGSLGAAVVNNAVVTYAATDPADVAIVHITGAEHAAGIERLAGEGRVPWRVVPFEQEMQYFYAAADLVVCRAGGILSELAVTGTPSVLIPRAAGSAKHQDANARHLAVAGAAEVVAEEHADRLPGLLDALLRDTARRTEMSAAAVKLGHPDAAARIANELLEAVGGRHG